MAKNSLTEFVAREFKYQFSDYKRQISKYIFDLWEVSWNNNNGNKFYEIQKNINQKFKFRISKTDFIKYSRLKIGHCNFSHKYIIEKSQPPSCTCGEIMSVSHLFNDCVLLSEKRRKFKINNIQVLSSDEHFENVKQFLNKINLFKLI